MAIAQKAIPRFLTRSGVKNLGRGFRFACWVQLTSRRYRPPEPADDLGPLRKEKRREEDKTKNRGIPAILQIEARPQEPSGR